MKKIWKRVIVLITGLAISLCTVKTVYAEDDYTYNYDYWSEVVKSPDAYEVAGVFTSVELGLDTKLNFPEGLFVKGDLIYVCDTGNNRILELKRADKDSIKLVRIIDHFEGAEENNTFSGPTDIAVSDSGELFIADKNNERIIKLDHDLNFLISFTKPTDTIFDQSIQFLPSKIAIDTAGRVFCVATNVNKGLVKYESNGSFAGFIGATKVTFDWTDYIWKRIATKEQRAQMNSFVPTEYDNLYMDYEGFVYVCTTNVSGMELSTQSQDPIRRLNMMGDDILVRNGSNPIIGDLHWGDGGGYSGPSMLCDITTLENDVFVALDKTRGRLFAYDDQGRMLYAFGGNGNMDGYFKQPTAIEHQGHDLLVLDSQDNSITLFTPTTYGKTIFHAIEEFQAGEYEKSGESWMKVMSMNGNYDLAYIGIGRSLLRQKKYYEAMQYFSSKLDDDNYSKAFKEYRKEWVEDNIITIFALAVAVVMIPLIIKKGKEIRHEIDTSDLFKE